MAIKNTMTVKTFAMRNEILKLMREGMTSKELSEKIKLPTSTTNHHVRSMLEDRSIKKSGRKVYKGKNTILYVSIIDSYKPAGLTLLSGSTNSQTVETVKNARIIRLTDNIFWTPKTPPLTGLYKRVSIGSTFGMV